MKKFSKFVAAGLGMSMLITSALSLGVPAPASAAEKPIVTLKYLANTDSFDPMEDYQRELILETLGVEIIPEMADIANSPDRLNIILNSGEEYDMIKITNINLLGSYIKNNVVYDLTDTINEYGSNLNELFDERVWDMVSLDKKIYAIPETDTTDVEWGIAVREDWIEALDIDLPTTPDEFYTMLKKFKDEDPGEIGKDKVIPISGSSGITFNGLAQAFGLGAAINDYVEIDGKLVNGLETPGALEFITYLNKLYKEELLDADFPANQNQSMLDKLSAGIAGAGFITPWESATQRAIRTANDGNGLVYLPPLKAEDGSQKIASRGGLKNYLIVPKASKKVKEVVEYCNAFLDDENYTKLILGVENDTYMIEDGKYLPVFPAFDKLNKGRFFYPTNEGEKYTPLFGARAHKELEMGELWDDLNGKAEGFAYIPVTRWAPLIQDVINVKQKIDDLAKEKIIKMIIDENELKNFDAFVADWKSKGGDAVTDEYNNWYSTLH